MSKKYDTIYLDWDGVIWDFMQAFCDWNGVQVPDTDKWEFYLDIGLSQVSFHEILANYPWSSGSRINTSCLMLIS